MWNKQRWQEICKNPTTIFTRKRLNFSLNAAQFLRVLCYLYLTKKREGSPNRPRIVFIEAELVGKGRRGWWGGGVVGGGGAFLSFSFFSFSFSFIFFLSSLSFFVFDVLKGFHFFITLQNVNGNILSWVAK